MKILITGGAGFIGINAAMHFLQKGDDVVIFDNFSRLGGRKNIEWLQKNVQKQPQILEGDIRTDREKIKESLRDVELVLHLAGQVAVTTSVVNPREDFEINALGTFNMLESIRELKINPIFIYSSTNKVYGGLEDISIKEEDTKYVFTDLPNGIAEKQPLDFHSPYGCSKGAGDQYVRDYSRIYGLRTIVFRQSCIYGPRQFGIEDQGWLAWFMIALAQGKEVTIYGNGKQVRDVLYIDDLVEAYSLSAQKITISQGQIYNIGGGKNNTLSIWYEFRPLLEELFQKSFTVTFSPSRAGDQPIYISDIQKAENDFGWTPQIDKQTGIRKLYDWVSANKELFSVS